MGIFGISKFITAEPGSIKIQLQENLITKEKTDTLGDLPYQESSIEFFDKRNSNSIKTSKMKNFINKSTYVAVKAQINVKDYEERLKIRKASKYLKPSESLAYNSMIKKLKNDPSFK